MEVEQCKVNVQSPISFSEGDGTAYAVTWFEKKGLVTVERLCHVQLKVETLDDLRQNNATLQLQKQQQNAPSP